MGSEMCQPHLRECPSRYSQVSIRARKKKKKTLRKEMKEIREFANDT